MKELQAEYEAALMFRTSPSGYDLPIASSESVKSQVRWDAENVLNIPWICADERHGFPLPAPAPLSSIPEMGKVGDGLLAAQDYNGYTM